jgi:FkbM family methyltransferase
LRAREILFWQVLYKLRNETLAANADTSDRVALELVPGVALRLTASDAGHLALRYCGFAEYALSKRMLERASSGSLLVDVGANHGYFTCLWAAANPANTVVAFEPAPTAFAALALNVAENGFADRVALHQAAAGAEPGTALLVDSPDGQSGLSHVVADGDSAGGAASVAVTTLDDVFSSTEETIDVLKVDAEGADALVLRGAERLLRDNRIAAVFFEHDAGMSARYGIMPDEPKRLLVECGYTVRRFGRFVWMATRADRRGTPGRISGPSSRDARQR